MFKKLSKILFLYLPLSFVVLSFAWVVIYKYVPVTWTPLMLKRSIENRGQEDFSNKCTWVDIEEVSPLVVRAVMAAEDCKFMHHHGIDFGELQKMTEEHLHEGKRLRGCSTISQQVAKNCFTFCGDSWWRKGFELYYTMLIELIWGKERIMEVYLNVAETGKGIYGVEEAAMRNFKCHASKLNMHQAVSIACVLPNPIKRTPKTVAQTHKRKYKAVLTRTTKMAYPFTK